MQCETMAGHCLMRWCGIPGVAAFVLNKDVARLTIPKNSSLWEGGGEGVKDHHYRCWVNVGMSGGNLVPAPQWYMFRKCYANNCNSAFHNLQTQRNERWKRQRCRRTGGPWSGLLLTGNAHCLVASACFNIMRFRQCGSEGGMHSLCLYVGGGGGGGCSVTIVRSHSRLCRATWSSSSWLQLFAWPKVSTSISTRNGI